VYRFDASTPRVTVKLDGYFSSYDHGDNSRVGYGSAPTITDVPVPVNAEQSEGSDGHIVFWDPEDGTEWSFWQWHKDGLGNYHATNGYRSHTTGNYNGRFADGLSGRGAGTTYLSGLVRKWEIDQGEIDHALSFAYHAPAPTFVYPASKSDGGNFGGQEGADVPEGTRLQLDPNLSDADFDRMGLSQPARIIAKALQRYGMYVIDNSGSSKIYLEDRKTAGWDPSITRDMVSALPWNKFRVLAPPSDSPGNSNDDSPGGPNGDPSSTPTPTPTPTPTSPSPSESPTAPDSPGTSADAGKPTNLVAVPGTNNAKLTWAPPTDVGDLTGYEVSYRPRGGSAWQVVSTGNTLQYVLANLLGGTQYNIRIRAVRSSGRGAFWTDTVQATPFGPNATGTPSNPPALPSALRATSAYRSAVVSWMPPASGDSLSYEIGYRPGGASEWNVVSVPGPSQAVLDGLDNDITYNIRIRSINAGGKRSAWTDTTQATPRANAPTPTGAPVGDRREPAVPNGLQATAADSAASVTWTPVPDAAVYEISYRATGAQDWTIVPGGSGMSFTVPGLANGVTYNIRMRALDWTGNDSHWTDTVQATPRSS